ncbi:helix-hairpin-helix domain-containing protein [Lacinutrix sp. C3R15]|uniref:ComEA family DNA-binding protein n=1 Tax=Flavobacteriaceae TaxID=49546 RepID=UPI001C08CF49|nr:MULTISPECIES: helix-hairpin-helix domain-containing protein [Flavobacteriaceae]MBU2939632.1 helix-hairpin-helix domain-containing protein [Lacinutrix sp. C3R15]MDO6622947.1 helix-hairpin-helix domain-containing protein [Oceanihabitans sp. 1_MG-2023]
MNLKSHFQFTNKQRNGIFLLLTIIVTLQCVYAFVIPKVFTNSYQEDIVDQNLLKAFKKEVDSLRKVAIEKRKPKIYPFNPNYISDYKGFSLGMSSQEIDRLLEFRKQNQWVNSTKQFQQVTKVSDSLLNTISPFFKFPEWVTKPKVNYSTQNYSNTTKTFSQKIDLNIASASQLQKVNGIGKTLSERIITYRNKQQGFIADAELQEVYGLKPEVIKRLTNTFTVKTPKAVTKIYLNTATREELVTVPYIDYEVAHEILEQRTLREGFNSVDELTKVKGFPVYKIDIIKLYLAIN